MPTICHVIVIHVLFCKKKESFRFFSLARFLKLKIAARQQSIEICNARRYWSMLVVYCVDIRLKVVFFYCDACHCFYRYTDAFLLCIFYRILECDILWMYLFLPYCVRKWHNKTVQPINQCRHEVWHERFNSQANKHVLSEALTYNQFWVAVV